MKNIKYNARQGRVPIVKNIYEFDRQTDKEVEANVHVEQIQSIAIKSRFKGKLPQSWYEQILERVYMASSCTW